jgi:hypothetical protein
MTNADPKKIPDLQACCGRQKDNKPTRLNAGYSGPHCEDHYDSERRKQNPNFKLLRQHRSDQEADYCY